jgi:alpha-beta hydrolase superfamily lysophospholipase
MTFTLSRLERPDGAKLALYVWPAPAGPIKATIQIAHGLGEHAARYDRAAQALTRAGYAVYASDHRGHGQTAQKPEDLGFFADSDGWTKLVEDLFAVSAYIAQERASLPHVLFAHSFGSFVAQDYLSRHGDTLAGAVLSGTNSGVAWMVKLGIGVAYLERLRVGPHDKSGLLFASTIGEYNRKFAPNRTSADWLSRDAAEVDKYVADPLCGFDLTVQGWIDLMGGLIRIEDTALQRRVPKSLPVYLMAGAQDPVGRGGKGPRALLAAYERAGMSRVSLKLYEGARHETLNEINRDQVVADLIAWLDANITQPPLGRSAAQHA